MSEKTNPSFRRRAFGLAGAAALMGLLTLGAAPAKSQTIFELFAPAGPSAWDVHSNLERMGFQVRSAIVRRGDVYLCDVVTRNGDAQRLIIDARTGYPLEGYPERLVVSPSPRRVLRPRVELDALIPAPRPRTGPEPFGPAPRTVVELVPIRVPLTDDGAMSAPRRRERPDRIAMGGGPAPQLLIEPPGLAEPKPVEHLERYGHFERYKIKSYRPRPAPQPTVSSAAIEPAAATPSATAAPAGPSAPASTPSPTAAAKPAAIEPAPAASSAPPKTNSVADSQPAAKTAPTPRPTPTGKSKAINDIPVTPLD